MNAAFRVLALLACGLAGCSDELPPPTPPEPPAQAAPVRPNFSGVWLAPQGALVIWQRGGEIAGSFASTSGTRYPIRGAVADGLLVFGYGSVEAPWEARLRTADGGETLTGRLSQVDGDASLDWRGQRLGRRPDREVAALAEALRRDEAPLRRAAADVLGALGLEARPAVPALVETLGDLDESSADAADVALARIGPPDPDALPELLCGLRSTSSRVRIGAADALGQLGAAAAPAAASLEAALEDEDPVVRHAAARALGRRPWTPGAFWPQWRGPRRDNLSTETGLLQAWPEGGPRLLWASWSAGRGIAAPALRDGRLFTLGYRGDHEIVSALDELTGRRLWVRAIGPSKREDGLMRWLFQRTPTVDRDLLFAFSSEGALVALNVRDGREAWRRNYALDFGTKNPGYGMSDYPIVDGERLICTPAGAKATLAALDKATGRTLWTSIEPSVGGMSHGATVGVDAAGERQWVALLKGGLFGFRAADGGTLWSHGPLLKEGWETLHSATPIPAGDRLVVPHGYFGDSLSLFDLLRREGAPAIEKVYTRRLKSGLPQCSALAIDGHLYDVDNHGLRCIRIETGDLLWRQPSRDYGGAALTWAEGHLYVHHADGRMSLMATEPSGPCVVSEFRLPGHAPPTPGATSPVVAGGRLYVRSESCLYCFDLRGDAGGSGARPRAPAEAAPGVGPLPPAVFVPTPAEVAEEMVAMAGVKAGDVVVDLGSGDGRLLIAAARRGASKAVGYEIDESLARISLEKAREAGVGERVRVEVRDLFTADLAEADVVFLYLPPDYLERLRPRFGRLRPGARIVSHEFVVPGLKPDLSVAVECREDGKTRAIHLWTAPLREGK